MVVSKNRGGPPKSSILIGFSLINHPFWGTPIFGNTQISRNRFRSNHSLQSIIACLLILYRRKQPHMPHVTEKFLWSLGQDTTAYQTIRHTISSQISIRRQMFTARDPHRTTTPGTNRSSSRCESRSSSGLESPVLAKSAMSWQTLQADFGSNRRRPKHRRVWALGFYWDVKPNLQDLGNSVILHKVSDFEALF